MSKVNLYTLACCLFYPGATMSSNADKYEVARTILGNANSVDIHTGNIINWNMMKKQKFYPSTTSSDELIDGIYSAVMSWVENNVPDSQMISERQNVINISNSDLEAPIDLDHRESLKLCVKLFLCGWKPELVSQAISKILLDLGVTCIDSVIVSFPVDPLGLPETVEDADHNNTSSVEMEFYKIKPIWKALQSAVESGIVTYIGVCDFDKEGLKLLHDWAKIKPSINQISLINCFVVSTDLVQYTSESNIDLLTHNDPPEILPARRFQSVMSDTTHTVDPAVWTPSYVARYSVLVRYRGIVHSKGYFVSSERKKNSMQRLEEFASS